MRKFRKIAALLLTLLLALSMCAVFAGCGEAKETWSLYVYLCGSNLETRVGAASKNLEEILTSKIPSNVNVMIQTGGSKRWRSNDIPADSQNRWTVKNGKLVHLEQLPQSSMGDEATFTDFLDYGMEQYPADKKGVIIWDHGGGSVGGVANDENYNFDPLTLSEMDSALQTVSEKHENSQLEFFGFDACLMTNYETALMLSPYAKYLVASEEVEPSGGWDYKTLFETLSKDPEITGDELGKALCDGYFEKCKKRYKDATATLSVTDLSKMGELEKAFDSMAKQMTKSASQPKGIQSVASSARNSQKFGGTSSDEGYSNLVDLRHFSENAVDIKGSKQLMQALDEAIVYKVSGSEKSKSSGMSFYYPLNLNARKLDLYYDEICPSKPYKAYLKKVYENIPENPIVFSDLGSERKDGSFQIKLDEKSRNYILSVDFRLLGLTADTGDEKVLMAASWLGMDNDLFKEWDTLTFHSNFRGIWLTLNGSLLKVMPVERTDEYIIFTSPILLNGKHTNLRYAFVWDDSYENGGYYKILGAWNGIDPVTGMADKEMVALKPTDVIQTMYPYETLFFNEKNEFEYSPVIEKKVDVPQGEYVVSEEPLPDTGYQYQFVVTDIFGQEHYSYIAWMEMTKTPEELKKNPLKDGEYAAEVFTIMESTRAMVEGKY